MTRRALLVGAGDMGKRWARLLGSHPRVDLAGWVDLVPDLASKALDDLGLPPVFVGPDVSEAIGRTEPDFLVNVTVPAAHLPVGRIGLEAGLPVLSEKPLAETLEQAKALVQLSEGTGRLLMVSQNRRYHRGLAELRSLVRHQLGRLGLIDAGFYVDPHFGGFRDQMDSPLLVDMAIHTFDAARYVTGTDPVSAYCEESNPPWSWYRGAAAATALFELSDGSRFTYHGSWCAPGLPTSWDSEWRVVGENGSATWDGIGPPRAELVATTPEGGQTRRSTSPPKREPGAEDIEGSLADFLRALDTGETPMGECHDNIKSLAMVTAAVQSARQRRRVPVHWTC